MFTAAVKVGLNVFYSHVNQFQPHEAINCMDKKIYCDIILYLQNKNLIKYS